MIIFLIAHNKNIPNNNDKQPAEGHIDLDMRNACQLLREAQPIFFLYTCMLILLAETIVVSIEKPVQKFYHILEQSRATHGISFNRECVGEV